MFYIIICQMVIWQKWHVSWADSLADNRFGVDGVAVENLDPAVLGEAEVVGLDVTEEQRFLVDRVELFRQVHHLHGSLCARAELGEGRRPLPHPRDGERLQLLHKVKAAAGAVDVYRVARSPFRLRERNFLCLAKAICNEAGSKVEADVAMCPPLNLFC